MLDILDVDIGWVDYYNVGSTGSGSVEDIGFEESIGCIGLVLGKEERIFDLVGNGCRMLSLYLD